MKNLRWLALTCVLFVATLGLTGWSSFTELGHLREWKTVSVESTQGELDGVRVTLREARAAVVEANPDRALLFVRIDLQGPQASLESWLDCRVSLQAADGQRWLPVYGGMIRGAIQILASDEKDHGNCSPANVTGEGATTFDQIYRLPRSALDNLTLKVSGYGTRPSALAFSIKPDVREFKSP